MKRLLRITVLFSVTLLWWGEKGYAATPAMDAAEKETVSATVEAEADKKDPKSDKKSDEPKRKRNLGHLSGSFETNTIYYVEDSKTGAVVPHNSYGSNNFLKLDYQLGRFSAGVQLEYYPHPLVGTPMQGYEYVMEGFSINNLTEKYISWTDRNYSVTVGDFYEQFGSGLILRAWEDRALGFNNSLGGARVTFNIKDIVEGKVLYAFPRFNLGYLSTQIAGGDLSFSLSNAIGLLDHRLSLEGSIVNRHFKNLPSWYTEYRDDYDFDLSKNVISYSGRVNYEYRGLSAKFEYVGKSKDVYLDNMTGEEVFKRGDAQLFEIGYTGSNYAVMAQFRRLNYMQSQLYRPDGGSGSLGLLPGNTINYIPALSPQHTYMLAGLDPNSPQQNGEIGGQIDATVQFQQAGNYKIACVLVENNIENKETYSTFDHVLRAAQTDMEGDAVTPAVTAPEERTFNFEATIGEGWNAENCAFVVYVFKEEANGKYIVNNGAECALNGSVDYRYNL